MENGELRMENGEWRIKKWKTGFNRYKLRMRVEGEEKVKSGELILDYGLKYLNSKP